MVDYQGLEDLEAAPSAHPWETKPLKPSLGFCMQKHLQPEMRICALLSARRRLKAHQVSTFSPRTVQQSKDSSQVCTAVRSNSPLPGPVQLPGLGSFITIP